MAADGTTSPQPSALAWRTDRRRNPRLVPAGNTTAALDRIMVLTRLLPLPDALCAGAGVASRLLNWIPPTLGSRSEPPTNVPPPWRGPSSPRSSCTVPKTS